MFWSLIKNYYFSIISGHISPIVPKVLLLHWSYIYVFTPLFWCFKIVLQSASKLLDTGLNTVQSTLLLKKQVEVEKVQEDLDIKRRQFAERMTACKRKEEELKKKQTQVCIYN